MKNSVGISSCMPFNVDNTHTIFEVKGVETYGANHIESKYALLELSFAWNEAKTTDAIWQSEIGYIRIHDCEIVPLTSKKELEQEGKEMHHCVASYWLDCTQGVSRIFSIKSPDGRSTLELRKCVDIWDIAQHLGNFNDQPPTANRAVAYKVLCTYQELSGN